MKQRWRNASLVIIWVALMGAGCNVAQREFALREGDLLFQDSDCGPFCEAIESVTYGVDGFNFSHVGLVMRDTAGALRVMEATTSGVLFTPIDSFLSQSVDTLGRPKVAVGRLKAIHRHLIRDAIAYIAERRHAPYDYAFDLLNERYYCSELIHLAFEAANEGQPLFETPPMTFKAPGTDSTFAVWTTYFEALALPIPEGAPGLNPGSMSRSPYLDLVHPYGTISRR